MNYKKIHDRIILRARKRDFDYDGYYERHHVIPKCLKENNNTDIVKLYPEEHFIIHLLLCKIYPDNDKLKYAVRRMSTCKNGQSYNNKKYALIKKHNSKTGKRRTNDVKKAISIRQHGENNSNPRTLSNEKVKLIKKDCILTLFSNVDLGKKYNVSCETIRRIRLDLRFADVTI